LVLKSATESFHQWDRLSKKPRFSAGACGAVAFGGGGCGGSATCGESCGADGCGPPGVAGAAAELADDGGSPLCASAAPDAQASDNASKAPQTQARVAFTTRLLVLPGVTATPPWPIHDPRLRAVKRPPRHLLDPKLGREIGRQQGQKRRITALKLGSKLIVGTAAD
jgi:hypothetical protein